MTAEGTRFPRLIAAARSGRSVRGLISAVIMLAGIAWAPCAVQARVLDDGDLERISAIKTSFTEVVMDVGQSSQRPDLSSADRECISSTLRELLQISEELKSYEYLITIENELKDFGDDNSLKGILRFAVDKALIILETERKRLGQLSEQCSRYPLSASKMQRAMQFIDGTAAILRSIVPRL
jgi:hypothetical protein